MYCLHPLLRNSCPFTTSPTFFFPLTPSHIYPLMNSLLLRTNTGTYLHLSPMPRSLRQNPIPFLDVSSCFTSFILICFALPPALQPTGLHFISRMFSSLSSAAAPQSLHSTGSSSRFPFLHRMILYLSFSLVQHCGSLP